MAGGNVDGEGAARRRRERRLRLWLRHERAERRDGPGRVLCRRWWTSWWPCSHTSILSSPSRLSPCPRSRAFPALPVRFFLSRKWQNSWWKCQLSCLMSTSSFRPLTFQLAQAVVFFRGQSSSTSAEQTTDIPVPGRLRGLLQGFSPGQSSTQRIVEQNVGLPVPRPRPSRRQGSQRTVEQIIGFPVSRTRDGGGLPGVHLQWGSTARGGARDAWLRRVLRSLRRGCMPSLMRSRPCSVYRDPSGARTAADSGTWYAGFAVVQVALCLRCSHHGRFGPEGPLRGEMSRSSSFLAVACTRLVLLVRYAVPFSGCSPRCSASCLVCTRPTVTRLVGFAGTMHLVLFSIFCPDAHDVRHHGRYDQREFCGYTWPRSRRLQWHAWLVLLVTMHFGLRSLMLSSCPRCSASWSVWTRRTVVQGDLVDLAMACARLVLLVRCSTCCVHFACRQARLWCWQLHSIPCPCSRFISTAPCIWQPLVRCLAKVQVCGLFWEITSRNVSVFSVIWFDSRYCFMSVHGGFAGFRSLLRKRDWYAQCKLCNFLLGHGC